VEPELGGKSLLFFTMFVTLLKVRNFIFPNTFSNSSQNFLPKHSYVQISWQSLSSFSLLAFHPSSFIKKPFYLSSTSVRKITSKVWYLWFLFLFTLEYKKAKQFLGFTQGLPLYNKMLSCLPLPIPLLPANYLSY
jgi:hypothetical protein